jgi:RNA polymerase sigma-70 factor (ECF subfamily)
LGGEGNGHVIASAHDEAVRREQARLFELALEKLPDHYLQVFLLHYSEQLTFEEIGRRTDRSPDAARKIWARALVCLRTELGGLDEP